jgi:hypothetical protein
MEELPCRNQARIAGRMIQPNATLATSSSSVILTNLYSSNLHPVPAKDGHSSLDQAGPARLQSRGQLIQRSKGVRVVFGLRGTTRNLRG